jgi:iron complex outermembrane receptor protein
MKTILLSFMLLCTFWISAQAQTNTGNIRGKVTDSEGVAVQGATVNVKGSALGSATDENGVYELINIPAGEVTLVIANVGHETFEKSVRVEAGTTVEAGNSTLKDKALDHHEVTVEGRRSYKVDDVSPTLRLQTPILEVPQNIQVINSQVLADQQIFDMMEGVTRNVSGAVKQEHWENYALIYVRGSQINPFRNGMNTQMPWGPLAEDMSMVDKIEFVKGPAGFMMANGDPAGLYNIVTKKPTGSNRGEAALTLGSFQTYRGTLDLDRKLTKDGKLSARLNLMGQLKGTQRPNEFNNRYSIVPVLKYQLSKSTSVTAEYTLQYMQLSPFGSAYSFSNRGYEDLPNTFTSLDPRLSPTNIKDQSIFVTLNHEINENWKVTGQLAYLNYKQTGSSIWPTSDFVNDSILNRGLSIWDALGENKQGQFFVNGKFKTAFITHKILAGVDVYDKQYFADFSQGIALDPLNIYTMQPTTTTPIAQFDRSKDIRERGVKYGVASTGLYGQDELSVLNNRLRLTLALRYTQAKSLDPYAPGRTDGTDDQITPRIGLSVSITKNTTVYGLYDKAFIPQPGADFYGNRFRPITGDNIEAGIKKDWFEGRWNTSVSVYQLTKNGAITSDPAHPFMSIQLDGQTVAKGVEFDLKGELTRGLNLILNYAYLDSKVTKHETPSYVGVATPGSVGHVAAGWLSYEFQATALKGIGLSLGYTYQADRSAWYSFGGEKYSLPDYFKLDGAVSWQNEKFRMALNVNNILNEYLYSGAPYGGYYYWQAEPGRNIRASMAYKF